MRKPVPTQIVFMRLPLRRLISALVLLSSGVWVLCLAAHASGCQSPPIKESAANAERGKENPRSPDSKAARAPDKKSASRQILRSGGQSPREERAGSKSYKEGDNDPNSQGKKAKRPLPAGGPSRVTLVPPPPPIVPSTIDLEMSYPVPYGFLAGKNLAEQKAELTKRLHLLKEEVDELEKQLSERKRRAEQFESLFQEGVVSKRELEAAAREAREAEKTLVLQKGELDGMKQSLQFLTDRLEASKKRAMPKLPALKAGQRSGGSAKSANVARSQ
ncbi:MAG TPA: hypothetical protein V6D17_10275 [Candidatus Obscuribacterales bacterium]